MPVCTCGNAQPCPTCKPQPAGQLDARAVLSALLTVIDPDGGEPLSADDVARVRREAATVATVDHPIAAAAACRGILTGLAEWDGAAVDMLAVLAANYVESSSRTDRAVWAAALVDPTPARRPGGGRGVLRAWARETARRGAALDPDTFGRLLTELTPAERIEPMRAIADEHPDWAERLRVLSSERDAS